MDIHITARKFKAHREVRDYAIDSLRRLDRYYDGIIRSDIILSFERKPASIKTAEINLRINGSTLTAKEKSDEFTISIDLAIEKLIRRLDKVKAKVRKTKKAIRKIKESQPAAESDSEE